MFAYCGNNPIVRIDPRGTYFERTSGGGGGGICLPYDGRYVGAPSGGYGNGTAVDSVVASVAVTVAGVALLDLSTKSVRSEMIALRAYNQTTAKEKSVAIAIPKKPDSPVIFPVDPNTFNPVGLVKVPITGTKNGAFISWMDPLTNTEVFRWDENPNYPNGSHYHINNPIYRKAKVHFYPGDVVPEPYATIYFPFG